MYLDLLVLVYFTYLMGCKKEYKKKRERIERGKVLDTRNSKRASRAIETAEVSEVSEDLLLKVLLIFKMTIFSTSGTSDTPTCTSAPTGGTFHPCQNATLSRDTSTDVGYEVKETRGEVKPSRSMNSPMDNGAMSGPPSISMPPRWVSSQRSTASPPGTGSGEK